MLSNTLIRDSSSMGQVLPTVKLPFPFSRALCILTRPLSRTEMIASRDFLFSGFVVGGEGVEGNAASSMNGMCVI